SKRVAADRKKRQLEPKQSGERLPARDGGRIVPGDQIGVVAEQILSQPVTQDEADNRPCQLSLRPAENTQLAHGAALHVRGPATTRTMEGDVLDACAAEAMPRRGGVEIGNPDDVRAPQLRGSDVGNQRRTWRRLPVLRLGEMAWPRYTLGFR